jgi:hypothetical protein
MTWVSHNFVVLLLVPFQHGVCVMQVLLHEIAGPSVILINDRWAIFRTSMSKFVENSELVRNRFKNLQNVVDCNVLNL